MEALKRKFAQELLKSPLDPLNAALVVFGADTGAALRAAQEWPEDPIVKAEQARFKSEGSPLFEKDALRERLTLSLLRIVESGPANDAVKAAEAIGKIHGLIEKPGTTINNNVTANKVMVVKDHGTDDNWREGLRKQQQALKNGTMH